MSNFQFISKSRHFTKRWHRYSNFNFAATTALAPLALAEVPKAALALPLVFVEREGRRTLAAVLSLVPGQNLYVGPAGNWIAAYVPAIFRSHPFRLARDATGQSTLCVDEDSGLVVDGPDGELFLNEAGSPSAALQQVWAFLSETAKSEVALVEICNALQAVGVVEPWPVSLQTGEGTKEVIGLRRINEVALNELDDAAFGQLRRAGAIGVAYAQLLSMGNFSDLAQLVQARAQAEAAERARAQVKPMIMLPEDSSIDWDWSKIGKV